MKKLAKVKLNVRILECKSIDFGSKDCVVLKDWEDFCWMVGSGQVIYCIKNIYYIVNPDTVWCYEDDS